MNRGLFCGHCSKLLVNLSYNHKDRNFKMPRTKGSKNNNYKLMDHAFKSDEDFPDRIDVGFLRDILGWRNRFYDWVDEYEMSPMAGSILLQCYQSKFYTITSLEKKEHLLHS